MKEKLTRRIASIESFVNLSSSKKLSSYTDQELLAVICQPLGKAGEDILAKGIEELSEAQLLDIIRGGNVPEKAD